MPGVADDLAVRFAGGDVADWDCNTFGMAIQKVFQLVV
jgi:hypothetical protein